jgi:flavin reductase (DIM6/NTAB) family NADH-FMN oxidoreductase RutF
MNEIAQLFRQLSLGVYVVGVAYGERRDAFTAAWLMQASFDPPLLALSINPLNASYSLLHGSGTFTVNILKQGQLEIARRFGTESGREHDKLADARWHAGHGGAPILDEALAYFDCELTGSLHAGDHEVVLGRVIGGRILDPDAVPMSYAETGDMDGSSSLGVIGPDPVI